LKEDCVWAKAGHIVATEQFLLKKGTVIKNTPSTVSPIFNKADIFNVVREREVNSRSSNGYAGQCCFFHCVQKLCIDIPFSLPIVWDTGII